MNDYVVVGEVSLKFHSKETSFMESERFGISFDLIAD